MCTKCTKNHDCGPVESEEESEDLDEQNQEEKEPWDSNSKLPKHELDEMIMEEDEEVFVAKQVQFAGDYRVDLDLNWKCEPKFFIDGWTVTQILTTHYLPATLPEGRKNLTKEQRQEPFLKRDVCRAFWTCDSLVEQEEDNLDFNEEPSVETKNDLWVDVLLNEKGLVFCVRACFLCLCV